MIIKSLIAMQCIESEDDVQNQSPPSVEYFILESEEFPIGFSSYHNGKHYGICVSKTLNDTTREEVSIPFISNNREIVDNIIKILIKNTVTPISLKDILLDMNVICN